MKIQNIWVTTTDPNNKQVKEIINELIKEIKDFTESPNSHMGDIPARFHQLFYMINRDKEDPNPGTINIGIIWDATQCTQGEDFIKSVAQKALVDNQSLISTLNTITDLPLGKFEYEVCPDAIIFDAYYPLP